MGTATSDRPSTTAQRAAAACGVLRERDRARAQRPPAPGYRTLFSIPFHSAMSDEDAPRLAAAAGGQDLGRSGAGRPRALAPVRGRGGGRMIAPATGRPVDRSVTLSRIDTPRGHRVFEQLGSDHRCGGRQSLADARLAAAV